MLLKGKILSYKGDGNRDGGREGEGETITLSRCVICALQHPPPPSPPTQVRRGLMDDLVRGEAWVGGGRGGGSYLSAVCCVRRQSESAAASKLNYFHKFMCVALA